MKIKLRVTLPIVFYRCFFLFLFQAHDCQCQYQSCGEDDGRHFNVSPWKRPRRQIDDSDESFCFCELEFYGTTMYFFYRFLNCLYAVQYITFKL